ncbi:hypothetical protein M3Y96_00921600 [Aphelenchoides besseyi]|nr:hypothetical protein M3Y96_00921600 [Aphelenchoides besseyi]
MNQQSAYRPETDPFSSAFDPQIALEACERVNSSDVPTLDELEEELLGDERAAEFVKNVKDHENTIELLMHKEPKTRKRRTNGEIRRFREEQKQLVEQKRLGAIGIEHFPGIGYAMAVGGVYERLSKWVQNQARVTIKVLSNSANIEPNRLIEGVIVAYDKDWNLIMRDCDEVYTPTASLVSVQTNEKMMPKGHAYQSIQSDSRILSRHLKCSLINGKTIFCIYAQPS